MMAKLLDAILYSTGCNYCKSTVCSVQLFTFNSVLTVTGTVGLAIYGKITTSKVFCTAMET